MKILEADNYHPIERVKLFLRQIVLRKYLNKETYPPKFKVVS